MTDTIDNSMTHQYDLAALAQAVARLPEVSDALYLTFKEGAWAVGAGADPVDDQDRWAVNPASFRFGLVEWCDGQAGASILVPAGDAYSREDLALQYDEHQPGHHIAQQIAVDMQCLEGALAGTKAMYKTSTRGGVSALSTLATKIAGQSRIDPTNIVPLVRLASSHYMHRKHKRKTYVPMITIDLFDDMELTGFKTTEQPAAAPPAAPARTARSKA